jgi:crossover junction endodeoxyribonuclease RuvC
VIAVGFDPGFAFLGCGVVESLASTTRVLHHETFKTTSKESAEARLDAIANYIGDMLEQFKPHVVGYENQATVEVAMQRMQEQNPDKAGTNYSSRRVHEVSGIIRCGACFYQLPCYCLAPNTIKVAVLGKGGGRAKKQRMKDAVRTFFQVVASEHAADAIAVSIAAMRAHRHAMLSLNRSRSLIH